MIFNPPGFGSISRFSLLDRAKFLKVRHGSVRLAPLPSPWVEFVDICESGKQARPAHGVCYRVLLPFADRRSWSTR